jgi:hypothetical protein
MLLLPQNGFIPFFRGLEPAILLGQQFTLSGNTNKSVLVVTVAGPPMSWGMQSDTGKYHFVYLHIFVEYYATLSVAKLLV